MRLVYLLFLFHINLAITCLLPKGPIFTALSYWEALSAGSLNVVELFLLAEYLNGTAIEPYVSDLNSQHPFSGRKEMYKKNRLYSHIFSMDELSILTGLKHIPQSGDRITLCQGKKETNAILVMYNVSSSFRDSFILGDKCKKIIGINKLIEIQQALSDIPMKYWCISSKISVLPPELLHDYSINIIVNWQGIRHGQENRIQWYSKFIKPTPHLSQIFSTIHPNITQLSNNIISQLKKPYLTVHLRIGRMLALYHREAIEMPQIYASLSDSVIDCIVYNIDKLLGEHLFKGILVLDDFDEMKYKPEMEYFKNRMQDRLHLAFKEINQSNIDVRYSVEMISKEAGCFYNSTQLKNRWLHLMNREHECINAKEEYSMNYVILDLGIASHGDFILRVGMSLFGETMCYLGSNITKASCMNILHSDKGFREPEFEKAMKNDCPLQYNSYKELLLTSATNTHILPI